jgi:hypothetical protein
VPPAAESDPWHCNDRRERGTYEYMFLKIHVRPGSSFNKDPVLLWTIITSSTMALRAGPVRALAGIFEGGFEVAAAA